MVLLLDTIKQWLKRFFSNPKKGKRMRLLNSFFYANPIPFDEGTVLISLVGNQSYVADRIFPAGRYRVELQAGAPFMAVTQFDQASVSGRVVQEFNMTEDFIVRAYCGSKATSGSTAGINPYTGIYKVDGLGSFGSDVSAINHIFGNAGSTARQNTGAGNIDYPSSGNCLGNGAVGNQSGGATGAGSCLHIIPVGGVFGENYLRCFHATSGVPYNYMSLPDFGGFTLCFSAGSGSCYGGAGSGTAANITTSNRSFAGGSTPYGTGGAGVPVPGTNPSFTAGNNGTGIGAGIGGGRVANGWRTPGVACYFDGSQWLNSSLLAGAGEDGKIILTFLGEL